MPATAAVTTVRSACPLDCPDACSLEVRVEDGRVVKLDGDHRNPVTAGFICTKVRNFPEHLYGPDRLLTPALRVGAKGEGRFRPVSWDEALTLVARRLTEVRAAFGGEAILPYCYGGSNGALSQGTTDARLFNRLGSSRIARTLCAAETGRAAQLLYGRMPGVAYPDFVHARLIVVWGQNPAASSIHLVPYLREAQRRGAKLVVIDPRRIPSATQADLYLPVRPGTDLALALAVIHQLFASGRADLDFLARHATGVDELRQQAAAWPVERAAEVTGLAAGEIAQFAELYATSSPALIRCGWGPERNRNGGAAIAAILALPAVGGKFGVRGGGYKLSSSSAWNLDTSAAVGAPAPATRVLNMSRLGRDLLAAEPPIKALFVYNANPVASTPEQNQVRAGLQREDLFTVVFDQVMTDTARYADVVLPATTFLEHRELSRGYGAMVLQEIRPVVPAAGEARSNHEVFLELCDRLGLSAPGDARDLDAFVAAGLAANGRAGELASQLAADGIAFPVTPLPVQMVDVQPRTADGKIHLVPSEATAAGADLYAYQELPVTPELPLALISPATNRTISSTLGQLIDAPAALILHPADAAARGITDGAAIRVASPLGEVDCRARVSSEVRPGVVVLPKGLWMKSTANGATAAALAPDTAAVLAGGSCYNDARVEVSLRA